MARNSNRNDPPGPEGLTPLVEEFVARTQQGQRPSIEDFCRLHPQFAAQIRELFPALVLMHNLQPENKDSDGGTPGKQDVPQKIADYHIITEIGRGGMGVVYEAEQLSLRRRVALKVLLFPQDVRHVTQSRFQQEARAAAKMHHTNIVPVFEVGEDDGRAFYAMQLIQGQSLDKVIDELERTRTDSQSPRLNQPPSEVGSASSITRDSSLFRQEMNSAVGGKRRVFYRSVAKIGVQVADALAFAHARGVIHRDIKPSNLLLDSEGVVWVTDFGLAKLGDDGLTQTGDFLGTLRYMSPERFEGRCDVTADVYALGMSLYELTLQRCAYESADRLELVRLISHAEPAHPRTVDPLVPRDLETIILKSIDKEPRRRYRSARALEQDLQRFLNDEPILARRPSLPEQVARWTRRNRGLALAVVGIMALLSVLLVGAVVTAWQQAELRRAAEQNLYVAEMNLAGRAIDRSAATADVGKILESWLPDGSSGDLRGWEWYYLQSYVLENVLELSKPGIGGPLDAVWSPDQKRIATAHSDHRIRIWDARSGVLQQELEGHPNDVVALAWSSSRPLLAACDDNNNIWVWDLKSGQARRKFRAPPGTLVEQVAWDPAGTRLAWSSDSTVQVWDAQRPDAAAAELRGGPGVITALQWSPDGKRIAASSWRQREAVVWDVNEQAVVEDLPEATLVRWDGAGHAVAGWLLSELAGEIRMFQPGSAEAVRRFVGHTAMARFTSWSGDERLLLSAAQDQTVRVWNTDTGAQVRAFQGHTGEVLTSRFSPDGARVVSTSRDGTTKVWSATPAHRSVIQTGDVLELRATLQDRSEISSLSWNPDDDQLAVVGQDGRLRAWDAPAARLIASHDEHRVEDARWSPDGRWMAMDEWEGAELDYYPGDAYMIDQPGLAVIKPAVPSESTQALVLPHPQRCNGVAWAPDARGFATICNDRVLRYWELGAADGPDGPVVARLISERVGDGALPTDVCWNPREPDVIAVGDAAGVIKVWDPSGVRWALSGHRGRIHQLTWSPDGKHLASAGQDGTVRVWSLATGHQTMVLNGHHNAVFGVDWHPRGDRLATSGRDGTVKIWDPLIGAETLTLSDHRASVLAVAWSADGTQLASADRLGTVLVWDARPAYERPIGVSD